VQAMLKCCNEGKIDAAIDNLQELWYVCGTPSNLETAHAVMQGPRILVPRYNKHHVSSYQVDTHAVRARET
jgi:hypothetical protein